MNRLMDLVFDGRRLLIATGVLIVACIVASFFVMGSPARQREARIDEARIEDLQALQMALRQWHREHGTLPADLAVVASQPGMALDTRDPVTSVPYRYQREDATNFRLCADFATDSSERKRRAIRYPASAGEWAHAAGEHCFKRRAGEKDD